MGVSVQRNNFIRFLNRNYCIAAHLTERLDELRESVLFEHLQGRISITIKLLEARLGYLEKISEELGTTISFDNNGPLIGLLEHIFSCLPGGDDGTQYICLLDYVTMADTLMAESAQLAKYSLTGVNLPKYELYDALTLQTLRTELERAGFVAS